MALRELLPYFTGAMAGEAAAIYMNYYRECLQIPYRKYPVVAVDERDNTKVYQVFMTRNGQLLDAQLCESLTLLPGRCTDFTCNPDRNRVTPVSERGKQMMEEWCDKEFAHYQSTTFRTYYIKHSWIFREWRYINKILKHEF